MAPGHSVQNRSTASGRREIERERDRAVSWHVHARVTNMHVPGPAGHVPISASESRHLEDLEMLGNNFLNAEYHQKNDGNLSNLFNTSLVKCSPGKSIPRISSSKKVERPLSKQKRRFLRIIHYFSIDAYKQWRRLKHRN